MAIPFYQFASRLPKPPRLLLGLLLLTFLIPPTPAFFLHAEEYRYPIALSHTDQALYVVDLDLPGVWRVSEGTKRDVFFTGSKRFREPLNRPRCVAVTSDGTVLVGDSAARDVFVVTEKDPPKPLTGGHVGIPMSIAIWNDQLYVADLETRHILKFPLAGGKPELFAKLNARGLFLENDRLWVVTQETAQLVTVNEKAEVTPIVEKQVFTFPHNVVVDGNGSAYVSDGYEKAIWQVKSGSSPEKLVSGEPLKGPVGLALAGSQIVIADPQAKKLFRLNPEDKSLTPIDQ